MLIEDGNIKKLSVCNPDEDILSDIYIGKVKNIVKNINAAFIEIKPGLLCYLSLEDNKNLYVTNRDILNTSLREGDELLVQISKEQIKTKDAVATTKLSISGKYCAISLSKNERGSVFYSKKINQNIKEKIGAFLDKTYDYDVIIRTKAEGCPDFSLISHEIDALSITMNRIIETAKTRTCFSKLYAGTPGYLSFLDGLKDIEYEQITTDDIDIYNTISNHASLCYNWNTDMIKQKIAFYQDSYSLNKLYAIETRISELLSKKVWLKSGGNIVIEITEALTVIDVNTAKCDTKKDKENTILKINLEAALEITRQLSLRNLSGIIIIDFINMENNKDSEQLISYLKEQIKKDSVKTNYIDITPLGLVELTRQKQKRPLHEQLSI